MKRLLFILTLCLFIFGFNPLCEAEEILYTVNANDNANQVLKFQGYEFKFNHTDYRAYLYREPDVTKGFQWTTSVISFWVKKDGADPEIKYDYWMQFYFGGPLSLVEEGQVYTKSYDGRIIQIIVEKISNFKGLRPPTAGSKVWVEETLPKWITFRLVVL